LQWLSPYSIIIQQKKSFVQDFFQQNAYFYAAIDRQQVTTFLQFLENHGSSALQLCSLARVLGGCCIPQGVTAANRRNPGF
jgi:hypothetical protein